MTDLRERIAAVLVDELFKRDAYTEYGTDDEPGQWERVDGHINITALADAVIRELGEHALAQWPDRDKWEPHW